MKDIAEPHSSRRTGCCVAGRTVRESAGSKTGGRERPWPGRGTRRSPRALRPVHGDAHQPGDGLIPPGEPERRRLAKVRRECLTELMQRIRLGGLAAVNMKAARLDGNGVEEEGLALATSGRRRLPSVARGVLLPRTESVLPTQNHGRTCLGACSTPWPSSLGSRITGVIITGVIQGRWQLGQAGMRPFAGIPGPCAPPPQPGYPPRPAARRGPDPLRAPPGSGPLGPQPARTAPRRAGTPPLPANDEANPAHPIVSASTGGVAAASAFWPVFCTPEGAPRPRRSRVLRHRRER